MTDDENGLFDDSRRSFMKKGALTTSALALGASTTAAGQTGNETGTGTGVEDDDDFDFDDAGGSALIVADNFHPSGRFVFVSDVVSWTPQLPDVRDSLWTDYNTYMIQWLGTNEIVPLWVAEDANVGTFDQESGYVADLNEDLDRPQVWEMENDWSPLGDNERLTNVDFEPVDEDAEDGILDNDSVWGTQDQN